MKTFFVTGIGTGVGKTIVSAILTEALQADYWKPIQAGGLNHTDSSKVKKLISNNVSVIHTESYLLSRPISPHAAAEVDRKEIKIEDIQIPSTNNEYLIIEGAGGLMVPLSENKLILDLIIALKAEVILVSQHYLGSINHTLLTVEVLKANGIPIKGIIFNGKKTKTSEEYILQYTELPCLGRTKIEGRLNKNVVRIYAKNIKPLLF